MKKRTLTIALFLLSTFCLQIQAQELYNKWQSYSSYVSFTDITEADAEVFALADGNLFSYNKEDESITEYSKLNGMNDADVDFIAYDEGSGTLLLVYSNQNIDLYQNGDFFNLPDLKEKTIAADKSVLGVQIQSGKAFIATAFGLVVVNLEKREIAESYLFDRRTNSALIAYDRLLMFTDSGVYGCPVTENSYDKSKWTLLSDYVGKQAALHNGVLYVVSKGEDVILMKSDWSITPYISGYHSVRNQKNRLVFTGKQGAAFLEGDVLEKISLETVTPVSSAQKGEYWIATETGLAGYKGSAENYKPINEKIKPDSPALKAFYNLDFQNGTLVASSGGPFRLSGIAPGNVSILQNGSWKTIRRQEVMNDAGYEYFEQLLSVAISPDDPDLFYTSTFRHGIFEFRAGKCADRFGNHNSLIQANDPAYPSDWISALTFDSQGNLWALNSKVSHPLKMMNKKGEWFHYSLSGLENIEGLDRLLITRNSGKSQKWILSCFKKANGAVLDDNGTPEDYSDDKTVHFSVLTDQDGNSFSSLLFRCITEDHDGKLWLGTESGLFLFPTPQRIFTDNKSCYRIKVPRNDGTNLADFLLENESITEILTDPANRKWIATANNGIYLISADGLTTIHHFTTANSPLPSNEILALALDPQEGRLYIASRLGLISFISDAIEGKSDYTNVYAYPNPVRPDYNGLITVTGLMHNSLVKITDIGNNLIYQANSLGGQLTWDGRNAKGNRVSSGVYLVYGTSEDQKKGVVTKILFIK